MRASHASHLNGGNIYQKKLIKGELDNDEDYAVTQHGPIYRLMFKQRKRQRGYNKDEPGFN